MKIEIKRIDHLGIVAGTIKDLGIIEQINEVLGCHEEELLSNGEVVAGMIINGLGFVSKPLMLAPQFFEGKPMQLLIGEAAHPEQFNRHKIGRVLDKIHQYGVEKLFSTIAIESCKKEKVDLTVAHSDTTSYSLNGQYDREDDRVTVRITHGYSKDHRPDLKQIVQELMVAQDGGIPLATKTWSGNISDVEALRERAKSVVTLFAQSGVKCITADSKLYTRNSASTLNKIKFITRVPATIKEEGIRIAEALKNPDLWVQGVNGYKFQEFESSQYEIDDQRWVVVYSEKARDRSIPAINKKVEREEQEAKKAIGRLLSENFSCEKDAEKALATIAKKLKFHRVSHKEIVIEKKHLQRGRPSQSGAFQPIYHIKAQLEKDHEAIAHKLDQLSCFVLATNLQPQDTSETILQQYKQQDKVEKGIAFIKSPEFFADSLYLKNPARIEALLMIMVLSLLVYSLAQRRLRLQLEAQNETISNQIHKPTKKPTLRWIFELLEGIHIVSIITNDVPSILIEGLTALRKKILGFFSLTIQKIYGLIPLTG